MRVIDDKEYLTPPDNEAVKIYECYFCDSPIYEGDDCFEIDNLIYCEDCIRWYFDNIQLLRGIFYNKSSSKKVQILKSNPTKKFQIILTKQHKIFLKNSASSSS